MGKFMRLKAETLEERTSLAMGFTPYADKRGEWRWAAPGCQPGEHRPIVRPPKWTALSTSGREWLSWTHCWLSAVQFDLTEDEDDAMKCYVVGSAKLRSTGKWVGANGDNENLALCGLVIEAQARLEEPRWDRPLTQACLTARRRLQAAMLDIGGLSKVLSYAQAQHELEHAVQRCLEAGVPVG